MINHDLGSQYKDFRRRLMLFIVYFMDSLFPSEKIYSRDFNYSFSIQEDGNMRLCDERSGGFLWYSMTYTHQATGHYLTNKSCRHKDGDYDFSTFEVRSKNDERKGGFYIFDWGTARNYELTLYSQIQSFEADNYYYRSDVRQSRGLGINSLYIDDDSHRLIGLIGWPSKYNTKGYDVSMIANGPTFSCPKVEIQPWVKRYKNATKNTIL